MFNFNLAGLLAMTACVVMQCCPKMYGQYAADIITSSVSDTVVADTVKTEKQDLSKSPDIFSGSYKSSDATPSEYRFKPVQIIVPASLIAVGSFGVCNGTFSKLNRCVKDKMGSLRGSCYFHADDYIQYLPAVAYLGMGFIGVKPKNSFKERLAAGVTAYASMAVIVNITKYSVKEKRPDSGARNSFPSGHTATAFTGAELIREEYGNLWGAGAYVIAAGVAFLRLYNERHWLNDIIAGAGIGILSARVGYWMLPLYRKWFHWDKKSSCTLVTALPSYSYNDKAFSLTIAVLL